MTLCIDENNVSGKAVLRSQYLVMFFFPSTSYSHLLAVVLCCTGVALHEPSFGL